MQRAGASSLHHVAGWSSVEEYTPEFSPVADSNVIYTVHVYHPLPFTHQGATRFWKVAAEVAGASGRRIPRRRPRLRHVPAALKRL